MMSDFTIRYKTRSIVYKSDTDTKLVSPRRRQVDKFSDNTNISKKYKAEKVPGTDQYIIENKDTSLLKRFLTQIKSRQFFRQAFPVYKEFDNIIYFKNTYILKPNNSISEEQVVQYLSSQNKILSVEFGLYLIQYKRSNLQNHINKLNQKSWVLFADANAYNYTVIPKDRERDIKNAKYGVNGKRPQQRIAKLIGWDENVKCSKRIKVGIIDSGIDSKHYDLKEALNNEFKYDAVDFDNHPWPDNNNPHGTLVAGIVGARNHNNNGIKGIAMGCQLGDYRIAFNAKDNDGFFTKFSYSLWGLIIGLMKAANDNVDVICCSWGGLQEHEALKYVINYISTRQNNENEIKAIPMVFAAGNKKGPIGYPAKDKNVIAVAGVDRNLNPTDDYTANNKFYAGSKFGKNILIAACSTDITTTDMMAEYGLNGGLVDDFNYYKEFGGTSAAAPQVAACIALMKDKNKNLSVGEIKNLIATNSTPFPTPPSEDYGTGVLNITNTLLKTIHSKTI